MNCKVLFTRQKICEYLGISKETFYALVADGMPVEQKAGQWCGHVESIEDFFRFQGQTRKPPAVSEPGPGYPNPQPRKGR